MQQINENIDNKNEDEEYEILKTNYKDNNLKKIMKLISKYKLIIVVLSFLCIFLVVFIIAFYFIQNSKNKQKDLLINFYKQILNITNINQTKKNIYNASEKNYNNEKINYNNNKTR